MQSKLIERLIPIFIFLILILGCKDEKSDEFNKLDSELNSWIKNEKMVGAEVLIIRNEKTVFHEVYGWKNKEENILVEKNDIWSIKSMTKPIIATAILILVEEGKLSLKDNVSKYITAFKGNDEVSIHHLLSQTSGDDGSYFDGGYNVYNHSSLESWVEDWAQQESQGIIGEFDYSNFNYAALGYIISKVTGLSVEQYVEKRILIPLGMTETKPHFSPDKSWASRVSERYRYNELELTFEKYWSNTEEQPWSFFPAAFGYWMSGKDFATFLQMWLNKGKHGNSRILGEDSVEMALKIYGLIEEDESWRAGYGYGWYIDENPLEFRHGGNDGSVGIGIPSNNEIILYLSHSQGGVHKQEFQEFIMEL